MPEDQRHNFHEFSLQSVLFKGRPDLYFCYLKTEKLAHALAHLLGAGAEGVGNVSEELLHASSYLPVTIAKYGAGQYDEAEVLAEIYEALTLARLAVSYGLLDSDNAQILVREYEVVAEKISLGKHASPLSFEDLSVPPFRGDGERLQGGRSLAEAGRRTAPEHREARYKGQNQKDNNKGQSDRAKAILDVVLEKRRVSIKDIARIVTGCSEKTIQRELGELIRIGAVRKEGERRWSVYVPA